jgi:hypothetical protein
MELSLDCRLVFSVQSAVDLWIGEIESITMVEFRSVLLSKGFGYMIHLHGPDCLQKDWITKHVSLY